MHAWGGAHGCLLRSAHLMGNMVFDLHLRKWRRSLRCCLDAHNYFNSFLFVTVGALCPTLFTLHIQMGQWEMHCEVLFVNCTHAHPHKRLMKTIITFANYYCSIVYVISKLVYNRKDLWCNEQWARVRVRQHCICINFYSHTDTRTWIQTYQS